MGGRRRGARVVMPRSEGPQALAGPRVPPVTMRCAEQCHGWAGDGHARPGWRGGRAAVSPVGRSAVSAASSEWVRDASVPPTRASSSSLVSRPCTNAVFSMPITCSRSACDALRCPRPALPAAILFLAQRWHLATGSARKAYYGRPLAAIPRAPPRAADWPRRGLRVAAVGLIPWAPVTRMILRTG